MAYTLGQAAGAVGLSKSSILRALKRGTISASRDPITGNWAIEPAELHRAFQPVTVGTPDGASRNGAEPVVPRALLDAERARATVLEGVVEDLRRRLDAEAEERRRLTAILADQRAAPAPIRRWWRFGR